MGSILLFWKLHPGGMGHFLVGSRTEAKAGFVGQGPWVLCSAHGSVGVGSSPGWIKGVLSHGD